MEKIKQLLKKYEEAISYLVFGGLTTVVNIVAFFLLDTVLNMQYLVANLIAIIVSILFAFFTNKRYVFKSKSETLRDWLKEFLLFVGFRAVSGVFDMLSMWVLVDFLQIDTNISKILTQFIVVVLNYFFSKFFIFK
ncbi:Putative flippase GtrA (transmembrane translocase of bactoprenol-linked glucose) [Pisciglobus halotolerans]|uniref:Putative flippase GtrA (Transmembrane translocase of bactoprenol-linked glucose) n=1 Tax=Pisciglobus halotolerans TaxID=745365 RepID=A0A1I3CTX0_9LACT|nr:Putative flippase GtrA (transmembrane translocase of bactoprenol-linked glucose) [Pisciglobus halotolerans]